MTEPTRTTMRAVDCTDIKAMLSGLIDDEVDATARHEAERHLAECGRCRQLLDEAEALDELVQADVESLIDPRGLPTGFEAVVLDRTLSPEPVNRMQIWITWAGWTAAAAALVLAATIWVTGRKPQASLPVLVGRGMEPTANVLPATYAATTLRSSTLDEVLDADPSVASSTPISRDDSDALYFASILLGMVASPQGDIDQVRRAVEYDRLIPKLRRVRERLTPQDRAVLLASEALLVEVLEGPVGRNDLLTIRATIAELGLVQTLESLSDRWEESNRL